MYNFLIVEDNPSTLDSLKRRLTKEFPGSRIDAGETINGGLKLIDETCISRRFYNAIILDFRLPKDIGLKDEVDESLCLMASQKMPETVVAHITAYPDDPDINKHLQEHHMAFKNASGIIIHKKGSEWPGKLIFKLNAYFYGNPIKEQMNNLFGNVSRSSMPTDYRSRTKYTSDISRGSITTELNMLTMDIIEYWQYLDDKLKNRIKMHFTIDDSKTPLDINLI